YQQHNSYPYSF
nr:immunoglobulin light chain junction region [Macaca mulatta]